LNELLNAYRKDADVARNCFVVFSLVWEVASEMIDAEYFCLMIIPANIRRAVGKYRYCKKIVAKWMGFGGDKQEKTDGL
jgi:hypothetical protein